MHRLSALSLSIVLVVAAAVSSPPAEASSKSAKAECDDTGCAASARSVEEVPGRRPRPRRRAPSACTFHRVDVAEGTAVYRPDGSVIPVDGTGRWYEKRCTVDVPQSSAPFGTKSGVGEFGRRAETTDLVYLRRRPAAPPQELATEALGDLPLPEPAIATSPPPQFDSVVNVPVFLAVDAADWEPKSVTTGVPG